MKNLTGPQSAGERQCQRQYYIRWNMTSRGTTSEVTIGTTAGQISTRASRPQEVDERVPDFSISPAIREALMALDRIHLPDVFRRRATVMTVPPKMFEERIVRR